MRVIVTVYVLVCARFHASLFASLDSQRYMTLGRWTSCGTLPWKMWLSTAVAAPHRVAPHCIWCAIPTSASSSFRLCGAWVGGVIVVNRVVDASKSIATVHATASRNIKHNAAGQCEWVWRVFTNTHIHIHIHIIYIYKYICLALYYLQCWLCWRALLSSLLLSHRVASLVFYYRLTPKLAAILLRYLPHSYIFFHYLLLLFCTTMQPCFAALRDGCCKLQHPHTTLPTLLLQPFLASASSISAPSPNCSFLFLHSSVPPAANAHFTSTHQSAYVQTRFSPSPGDNVIAKFLQLHSFCKRLSSAQPDRQQRISTCLEVNKLWPHRWYNHASDCNLRFPPQQTVFFQRIFAQHTLLEPISYNSSINKPHP